MGIIKNLLFFFFGLLSFFAFAQGEAETLFAGNFRITEVTDNTAPTFTFVGRFVDLKKRDFAAQVLPGDIVSITYAGSLYNIEVTTAAAPSNSRIVTVTGNCAGLPEIILGTYQLSRPTKNYKLKPVSAGTDDILREIILSENFTVIDSLIIEASTGSSTITKAGSVATITAGDGNSVEVDTLVCAEIITTTLPLFATISVSKEAASDTIGQNLATGVIVEKNGSEAKVLTCGCYDLPVGHPLQDTVYFASGNAGQNVAAEPLGDIIHQTYSVGNNRICWDGRDPFKEETSGTTLSSPNDVNIQAAIATYGIAPVYSTSSSTPLLASTASANTLHQYYVSEYTGSGYKMHTSEVLTVTASFNYVVNETYYVQDDSSLAPSADSNSNPNDDYISAALYVAASLGSDRYIIITKDAIHF